MSPFDLDRIGGVDGYARLVDEVCACGELALHIQRRGINTERKGDESPVTEADRRVEERLRAFLTAAYPGSGFLGEESGAAKSDNGLRWIVDPIDGTRAFVRSIPTWSVLVGLEADGNIALGIALLPAAGDLFEGWIGGGARMNGRPCRLSSVDALGDTMVGHGAVQQFIGHEAQLQRIATQTYSQRGFTDFANYRELLQGRMDVVFDPGVKAYDVAPAAVFVHEAGGRFSDLLGESTIHGEGFLASNGHVHDAAVALWRG